MAITLDGTAGITQSASFKSDAYLDASGGNTATINGMVPVGTTATQTLTNKTLTAPTISGNLGDGSAGYGTAGQVLTSGGTGANTSWSSSQSIGIGQTWQDVSGSRATITSYQNLTGRPIVVSLTLDTTGRSVQVSVDNVTWIDVAQSSGSSTSMSFIVPANSYYRINGTTTIRVWAELR